MKTILANLGFILQMAGLFVILPIIISFLFGEPSATIALFIAAVSFFALGFGLNALCERKELGFTQSSSLIVLVFILLSIIGAIPYAYINFSEGDIFHTITDSIFESASGFTTTGFSVVPNISSLPKSIIFYRGLTQFIGGIGIVLVLLAFFYPEEKLADFSRSLGFTKNQKIKKTFIMILCIYSLLTLIMVALSFLLGYHDIINGISFVFSALSTGGFAPLGDITTVATLFPMNMILIVSMVLGAMNFFMLAGLFKRRFREFLKSEFSLFVIIVISAIILSTVFIKISLYDSTFHVISAMSTTGFSYLPLTQFTDSFKMLLIILMFIGGASFSTAGGIKIYRLVLLLKTVKKAVVDTITSKDNPIKLFGKEYSNVEIIQTVALVFLMIIIIIISSFIITLYGFKPVDSMFEATSAIATTGISVGVVTPSIALELKWLFIFLMLIGRVEIIAFLIIFTRTKQPKPSA